MDCTCQGSRDIIAAILDVMPNLKAAIPSDYQPVAREIESMLFRQKARIEERHERVCLGNTRPHYITPS